MDWMYFSAYQYLDQWLALDREGRLVLGFSLSPTVTEVEACEQLVKLAKGYAVLRNFHYEAGVARLGPLWTELRKIEAPSGAEDAKRAVNTLVEQLKGPYKHSLLSAASKFLWMRFGSPIIIYDSLAWGWMRRNGGCRDSDSYDRYCDLWLESYGKYHDVIREACLDLPSIRKFIRPSELTDAELEDTISSEWFMQRVFDIFICTREELAREAAARSVQ